MKKILVTQRLIKNENYEEIRDALDVNWAKLFMELNYLPILLPTYFNFRDYFDNFKIDGIFLTGGNDLSSVNNNLLSIDRDKFEKSLIEYGCEKSIPIFGVCRGMQLIAEFFGSDFKLVQNHVNIRHDLLPDNNSRYIKEIVEIREVNSFHNYAINYLADSLQVVCTSEDGVIEAIEHKSLPIFGQMWHTEREKSFPEPELNLIKLFFEGVK
ncbi:MAG: gamma-glutamyl-gamma-aminobutyrate hydrolase family protein [Candidatus Margulisiibacteriota bacterium]|jgi:putative glutamine amidotransferase